MDICKNCNVDFGLHHFKTYQCPMGGIEETREGHKQEWAETVYERDNSDYEETIRELQQKVSSLEKEKAELVGILIKALNWIQTCDCGPNPDISYEIREALAKLGGGGR